MLWKLFVANLKMIVRNRQSLFWAFMFPLLFTVIFGLFFGKNANVGTIGLVQSSHNQITDNLTGVLNNSKVFKITEESSVDTAKEAIGKNNISAALVIPEGFGDLSRTSAKSVTIIYDPGNAQVYSTLSGVVNGYLTSLNYQTTKTQPIFSIETEKLNNRTLTYFDFVLAGILGLALMNSSIMGVAIAMSKYREDKILKRITTTPLKSWVFIAAEGLSRLVLNIFQISLILFIGKQFFDAHIYGNIGIIYVIALFGSLLFQLLGFAIAAISKTTDAAEGMSQAIAIPMMFLAGVFFPIDALPKWLFSVVQFLPLAPLLRMIRGVTLEASSPFNNPINAIIVVGWIVILFVFSVWRFRLSEE